MSSAADLPAGDGSLRQRTGVASQPALFAEPSAPDHPLGKESPRHDASHDSQQPAKHDKPNKTYGRTPDGTVFIVPTTHDMVSQLLDPRQPKNLSDAVVLVILALHILLAYRLPLELKKPVMAAIFIFWRAAYNLGIGLLLRKQSNGKLMVTWAKRWRLFVNPSTGEQPRPWLYRLLKKELEAKIPEDYKFEDAPLEYNTWLVFRRLVDLILMCDFVSYCLFAIVCAHVPDGETTMVFLCRWAVGVAFFVFNVWVKLDAHRVVKDFAWYWGDFFYLVDQELTFDGVFEMAPHPMYSSKHSLPSARSALRPPPSALRPSKGTPGPGFLSHAIGYAGYYGISAMAASYEVLFISIAAHLAQLAFLVVVENPHINKTYNPPAPRSKPDSEQDVPADPVDDASIEALAPVHNLIGFRNIDLFRSTDYSVILASIYVAVLAIVTPSTPAYQVLFFLHALLWKLWFCVGIGILLTLQSKERMITRHFVKYGESAGEAWRQWKGLYHFSMTLSVASFCALCWKMYSLPEDWMHGWVLLRHVMGISLIALQIWTFVSVYDTLGEFGWFYGDFFFDHKAKLTYNSIYRFLNNPERIIGLAGLWGAAVITWSRSVALFALLSQILTMGHIEYVERPHMHKVYGSRNLREEAGLTKFIKNSLPPPVKGWSSSVDKVLDETRNFVDDLITAAAPMLASGVSSIARDTNALFNKYPARLTITRISPDLAGLNPKDYSLTFAGTPAVFPVGERATGKESLTARVNKDFKTQVFEYGAPIRVKWTAPANHSKKDWVGLYMVTDNRSREVTEVPSLGRWIPTTPEFYGESDSSGMVKSDEPVPDSNLVSGEMVFEGDKLWWTQGVFEFRYHHNGTHQVMSVSEPFEVGIGRFEEEDEAAIEAALLPVVRNCLDRDNDIAPNTVDERFGSHVERDSKYANRVVYAIRNMFGIEFAPAVVPADGNAPYSMSSHSNGPSTPTTDKFPEE
ncbi:phosphatidylethanolamine N-methyltransferase [Diaporthe helianthi]|uniref:Phosphatidylethanolamine N-methyltransferase n=1 Tax=Diaporthe helianthi TaxID=158607 RepID=A0A2P5I0Z0_DIAHE|nr:phosphatidylethanolamine N-methyltransferase [Diaporthe helianthi]